MTREERIERLGRMVTLCTQSHLPMKSELISYYTQLLEKEKAHKTSHGCRSEITLKEDCLLYDHILEIFDSLPEKFCSKDIRNLDATAGQY